MRSTFPTNFPLGKSRCNGIISATCAFPLYIFAAANVGEFCNVLLLLFFFTPATDTPSKLLTTIVGKGRFIACRSNSSSSVESSFKVNINKGVLLPSEASLQTTFQDPGGPLSSLSRPLDNHNSHSKSGFSSSFFSSSSTKVVDVFCPTHEQIVNPKHVASPCVCANNLCNFDSLFSSSLYSPKLLARNDFLCPAVALGTKSGRERKFRTRMESPKAFSKSASRRASNSVSPPFADDNVNDDGANEGLFFAEPMDLSISFCVCLCVY
mmetsp:Transcript_6590/g.22000  ORF Transcript_6590/g.22000 Transcript_6590/m.22000 type:complete len:267 (-) Transcript_6590:39-839(-)